MPTTTTRRQRACRGGVTPIEETTTYLRWLANQGMSDVQIAERSGVTTATVGAVRRGIRRGPSNNQTVIMSTVTRDALMGVRLLPPDQRLGLVDVTAARRMLRALARAGWTQAAIATEIGAIRNTVTYWGSGRVRRLPYRDMVLVGRFFNQHVRQCGGSTGTVQYAVRCGWLPWYAWSPSTIGDPDYDPHSSVYSTLGRRQMRALAGMGWGAADVAGRYDALDPVLLEDVTRQAPLHPEEMVIPRWVDTAIDHAYRDLSGRFGPSRELMEQARTAGWATPMAWEGIDIRDVAQRPARLARKSEPVPAYSSASISLAVAGMASRQDLNAVERVFVIRLLASRGMTWEDIARHLRWPGQKPADAIYHIVWRTPRVVLPAELEAQLPPLDAVTPVAA